MPTYVDGLLREIQNLRDAADERLCVHTIFFGGGTPSLLPASSVGKILHNLDVSFEILSEPEISLEANPGTLSLSYLQDLTAVGVNRLSLGMQSAHPRELVFLERQHSFDDVLDSVRWARQAGIENLSLDLIFGLPEQTNDIWNRSLTRALDLSPEHFSIYALTIEQGTPLYEWANRGMIPLPDPDQAAEMYELACERLSVAGYTQYEISNWARTNIDLKMKNISLLPKHNWSCQHNLQYWRNLPYLGFGAGAHGFAGGVRISNVLSPDDYIRRLLKKPSLPVVFPKTPATISVQPISKEIEMSETMMMGLRLTGEGVSRAAFQKRFKKDLYKVFGSRIDRLIEWGLLTWAGPEDDILRLTPRARLLGNRVFREFI